MNVDIFICFTHNILMVIRYIIGFIGNTIWKALGGVWLAIFWFALTIIFAVTLIGIPVAVKCFAIGWLSWKPTVRRAGINIESHLFLNIVWFLVFVWVIVPFALVSIVLQIATIFGIPLVVQWYKVLKVNLFPFGAIIK